MSGEHVLQKQAHTLFSRVDKNRDIVLVLGKMIVIRKKLASQLLPCCF